MKLKKLEAFVTNPILVGIIMLKDLIDIVKSIYSTGSFNLTDLGINWWDFSIKLLIAISLWMILRTYFKLKNKFEEQMFVFSLISHIRNKRLFLKSFENIEYYKGPYETDEEFRNRLPDGGLFKQHFHEEYTIVREELQNKAMKNKSAEEIDNLLQKWYPFTSIKKTDK